VTVVAAATVALTANGLEHEGEGATRYV